MKLIKALDRVCCDHNNVAIHTGCADAKNTIETLNVYCFEYRYDTVAHRKTTELYHTIYTLGGGMEFEKVTILSLIEYHNSKGWTIRTRDDVNR